MMIILLTVLMLTQVKVNVQHLAVMALGMQQGCIRIIEGTLHSVSPMWRQIFNVIALFIADY